MTKVELIEALATEQNLPLKDAKSIVDIILETMTEALLRGNGVEIRGFGSFQVRNYDSYIGRDPKTGKEIKVAPKKLPFFKPGKELREQMNGKSGGHMTKITSNQSNGIIAEPDACKLTVK